MIIEDNMCASGLGREITPYPYRITLFGSSCVLVEGVKKIFSFSPTKVEFVLKGSSLTFLGENFVIKKYDESEVCLKGKVLEVKFNEKG